MTVARERNRTRKHHAPFRSLVASLRLIGGCVWFCFSYHIPHGTAQDYRHSCSDADCGSDRHGNAKAVCPARSSRHADPNYRAHPHTDGDRRADPNFPPHGHRPAQDIADAAPRHFRLSDRA